MWLAESLFRVCPFLLIASSSRWDHGGRSGELGNPGYHTRGTVWQPPLCIIGSKHIMAGSAWCEEVKSYIKWYMATLACW